MTILSILAIFSILTIFSVFTVLTISTVLTILAMIDAYHTLLLKVNSVAYNLSGRGNLCYRLDVVITFQCSDNLLNGSNVCVDVVA